MDLKLFLEKVLGRKVDLMLADAVKPRLRSVILAEAVQVRRVLDASAWSALMEWSR